MATTYGKTWWGAQWLGALKDIDYSNRLPRGASYARNGMVKQIEFEGNVIKAKVQGSRITPYSETIKLPQFTKDDIDKFINLIVARPIVLSKLFNRQLDESLAKMAEKVGIPLFPKKWSDLKMQCSCPDWAVPCKHLAAVIYKTSMEIDNNPFLVFSLHGVDLLKELESRGLAPAVAEMMEVVNMETIINDSQVLNTEPVTGVVDYTLLHDLTLPLSNLLPPSPAFCHDRDFLAVYQKGLQRMVKMADRVLKDKQPLVEAGEDKVPAKHDACGVADLTPSFCQQLLNINVDMLPDYHPTIIAARNLVVCALQLLAHGCIVPQIFYRNVPKKGPGHPKKKAVARGYVILWQPAMIDEETRRILAHFGQQQGLLCKIITDLVHNFNISVSGDVFHDMFFCGVSYPFVQIGETNIPGGIRSWLDRYFMQTKYRVTFKIEETDNGFAMDVLVDDTPLQHIMEQEAWAEHRMEILRQLAILGDIVTPLADYINERGRSRMEFFLQSFTTFLIDIIPAMKLLGVTVVMPKALLQLIKPKVTLRMKSNENAQNKKSYFSMSDLLAFDWKVAVGSQTLTPEDFRLLLGRASGLLRFKEQYVYVDEAAMMKLKKALASPPKLKSGELLQIALSGEYLGTPIEMTDELRKKISQFTSQSVIPIPEGLQAQLRPYQERGFSWMYRNMKIGFGSILADDMGLGKTLQVITLLLKIKEEGGLEKKRALVVVPTGLLYNWQAEVARFAPGLSTAIYHGTSRNIEEKSCMTADILLTTYGIVRSDAELLKKRKWRMVIIDEAQNIKNSSTAQSKAIHGIHADTHIAMSGTPVENRLSEFWSIIDFTNKGYLGSSDDFQKHYARPIQKDGDLQVAERFRKVTAPFMMRRLKTDKSIIIDLPDKIERNEYATLTAEQAALYQKVLNQCMEVIENLQGEDSQTLFKRQGLILQMMLALKQICNHPTQYLKDHRMDASLSGKTEMLLDLLRSIVDANEKVLVFTQFREMGDLLQHFIREELNEDTLFYHGGCTLKQRQTMVDRFQNERNSRIFILSLKAAGTGLNLTAATHVIHYDLWWNPAVESQATDRAYRIGQHNNVQVHRFITRKSFEERIDAMIRDKKNLADLTVATGESWIGKLSNKELREVFG